MFRLLTIFHIDPNLSVADFADFIMFKAGLVLNLPIVSALRHYLSLCMRKPTILVPTRSDKNRAVQSQRKVRSLKFKKKRNSTIRVAKTKGLISFIIFLLKT